MNHRLRYCVVVILLAAQSLSAGCAPQNAEVASPLPNGISSVMHKPAYAHATWNLLVTDLHNGKTVYELNPDRLAFTGSVRKLFSVGVALNALGADHRFNTPVYRHGSIGAAGVLNGDLILVGAGDLTLGGRTNAGDTIAFTDFDHNDANNLGTAILTHGDPLRGLDDLARQVRAAGIRSVTGDVIVDDRLFAPYHVPNGNLLITPILVNENMLDVWIKPTRPGLPAHTEWRPKTEAFGVRASVKTVAAGQPADIALSNQGKMKCDWSVACTGTVTGTIPVGYAAPLSGDPTFVRTFRVEDPASFARIVFLEALGRAGVAVHAPLLAANAADRLPPRGSY
jgi:D-alanyl-D-alanine carboxypeptidase